MKFEAKELTPKDWPNLEKLFGDKGACAGCWCMSWRVQKGETMDKIKGETAKKRFRELVVSGKAHGMLAYHDGDPIGWCSFDKRTDFLKLDRAPSLKCDDANQVWSIPCFFIKKEYRGQGVATLLLKTTVKVLKKRGARIAEGYPAKSYDYGKEIPAAFAWTGTQPMFEEAGFKIVGNKDGGKQRVRINL